MAMSKDHPGLPFVQAQGYTHGRPDGPPLWVVWHSMEASEWSGRAESTAAYFANPSDGRAVSAHHCGDSDSVIQCVDEDDSAWTVGNRPGNYRGLNIELSGFARQSRTEWLDPFGAAMLVRLAPIVAASMTRWHIPNRWCSVADLRALRPGHTTHNDLRVAFGGTTHTDPGAGFPIDYVLAVVGAALNSEDDDMDDQAAHDLTWTVLGMASGANPIVIPARPGGAPARSIPNRLVELALVQAETSRALALAVAAIGTGSPEVAALMVAIQAGLDRQTAVLQASTAEAVADLGEGGARQVRDHAAGATS